MALMRRQLTAVAGRCYLSVVRLITMWLDFPVRVEYNVNTDTGKLQLGVKLQLRVWAFETLQPGYYHVDRFYRVTLQWYYLGIRVLLNSIPFVIGRLTANNLQLPRFKLCQIC